jgi:hypothetical protein
MVGTLLAQHADKYSFPLSVVARRATKEGWKVERSSSYLRLSDHAREAGNVISRNCCVSIQAWIFVFHSLRATCHRRPARPRAPDPGKRSMV